MKVNFDRWVSDNNPDDNLSYQKGWWDYIEFIRLLSYKFDFNEINVISTYSMKTPPPTEQLLMPVIHMSHPKYSFILKIEFAPLPPYWTISVKREIDNKFDVVGLFDIQKDFSNEDIPGFKREWIYPSYLKNPRQFTCQVEDEWDVYTLVRLVIHNT